MRCLGSMILPWKTPTRPLFQVPGWWERYGGREKEESKKPSTRSKFQTEVRRVHGIPMDIVLDRGPQFISRVWTKFCAALGATASLSSGYHLQGKARQEVREVFAQVLSDYRIPYTRVPVEPGLHSCQWLPTHLKRFYAQVEKDALDSIPVFRRYGIRWPEVYLGLTTVGQNMSVSNLQRALSHVFSMSSCMASSSEERVVTAELMVHPGYPSHPQNGGCGEGPDEFSQSDDRQHELSVLTDLSLLAMYRQERVQLCAFKDL
ncbi:carbohydrate deacetylase isoform X2 [Festucalex cinctus]